MSPSDSPHQASAGRALDAAAASVDASDVEVLREDLQAAVGLEYTVGECIGRGGMGAVFRANQETLDRAVAIKVMLPSGSIPRADWIERFQREARALAGLSHPGIVGVHSFGQTDRLVWIVMESVDGTSLRELMRQGRLTPQEALEVAPQICRAIQYAHDHGVVHRDIKPENVLLNAEGEVKLVDFGLAMLKESEDGVRMTSTAEVLGTLRYMAPEQLDTPKEVDHRADIFSLGVVIYEMLTGHVPQGVIEPPSRRVEVDVRLDEVVLRTLEREPERRFQAAADVAYRMDQIERDPRPVSARGDGAGAAAPKPLFPGNEREARLTQRRLGLCLDAVTVLIGFAVVASFLVPLNIDYGFGSWTSELGLALMAALGLPAVVGWIVDPMKSRIPVPFLRLASTFVAFAVLIYFARKLPSIESIRGFDDPTLFRSYCWGLWIVVLLPPITAVVSAVYPTGFQWSATSARVIVTLGVLACTMAASAGVIPWRGERPTIQWLFVILFTSLAIGNVRGSKLHAPHRVNKARALGMAMAGPLGIGLMFLAQLQPGVSPEQPLGLAIAASTATGILGGILGAGTRLRDLPASHP